MSENTYMTAKHDELHTMFALVIKGTVPVDDAVAALKVDLRDSFNAGLAIGRKQRGKASAK